MASLYQPLRTEDGQPEHDSYEDNPPEDDSYDMLREDQQKKTRDPLYIIILYATSLLVSIGGLGAGIWGYCIVVTGPLDEYSKKVERAGYEKYFWGMQSVVVLVCTQNTFVFVVANLTEDLQAHHQCPLDGPQLSSRTQSQTEQLVVLKHDL